MEEVKLLGSLTSPFVYRVKLALNFKGIKYDYLEQDVFKKSTLLVESNPINKKVPVLIHNGKFICESLVIIEYIDETWKENPLLPTDPYERAMTRFWAKFVEHKIVEIQKNLLLSDAKEQEIIAEQAKEALEILDAKIKGKKFFGGETIGLVDIALGHIPIWIGPIEEVAGLKIIDPARYPCLTQWMEDFIELPVVKENDIPPRDSLVIYFNKIRKLVLAKNSKK